MSLTIQDNVTALMASRYLSLAQSDAATSIQRLSSGLRINHASDDAAGLTIATGLRSQIGGIQVGLRNTQDAISVAQTADGALSQTHDILHRMRDLVIQAANAGSLTSTASTAIATELHGLHNTLNHIARTTTFNGTGLLTGTYQGSFQVGANAGDMISLTVGDMSTLGLALDALAPSSVLTQVTLTAGKANFGGHAGTASTFHVDLADDAAVAAMVGALADPATSFTVNGAAVDLTGVSTRSALASAVSSAGGVAVSQDTTGLTLTATSTGATPIVVTGVVGAETVGTVDVPDAGGNPAAVTGRVDLTSAGGSVSFVGGVAFNLASVADQLAEASTASAKAGVLQSALAAAFTGASVSVGADGAMTITASTASDASFTIQTSGASDALDALDAAIGAVSQTRGYLGAMQNRFEHVVAIQSAAMENLTAAESRIRDADFAAESVRLTRASILSQAATAMLSQATSSPRTVLALLS